MKLTPKARLDQIESGVSDATETKLYRDALLLIDRVKRLERTLGALHQFSSPEFKRMIEKALKGDE